VANHIADNVVDGNFGGRDPLTGFGLEENCRRARLEFGFLVDESRPLFRIG